MSASVGRKELLRLSKSELNKRCRKAKVKIGGAKRDMVDRLIKAKKQKDIKNKQKATTKKMFNWKDKDPLNNNRECLIKTCPSLKRIKSILHFYHQINSNKEYDEKKKETLLIMHIIRNHKYNDVVNDYPHLRDVHLDKKGNWADQYKIYHYIMRHHPYIARAINQFYQFYHEYYETNNHTDISSNNLLTTYYVNLLGNIHYTLLPDDDHLYDDNKHLYNVEMDELRKYLTFSNIPCCFNIKVLSEFDPEIALILFEGFSRESQATLIPQSIVTICLQFYLFQFDLLSEPQSEILLDALRTVYKTKNYCGINVTVKVYDPIDPWYMDIYLHHCYSHKTEYFFTKPVYARQQTSNSVTCSSLFNYEQFIIFLYK